MNLFSLGGIITEAWTAIWISLNSVIYQIVEWLYQVFESVANVNLFSREAFDDITSRLYVVIGVAMLFIFAYNIILMIINPDDKKSTGNTGKVVKETMIALVMVILLPTIFNYMTVFQKNVLQSHILEQIILGSNGGVNEVCDFSEYTLIDEYVKPKEGIATDIMKSDCEKYNNDLTPSQRGSYIIAPTIFGAFFHPVNYGYNDCVAYLKQCKGDTDCNYNNINDDDDKELCAYYVYDTNVAKFNGGILPFVNNTELYADAWNDKEIFDFNYLLAFISGILAVYMFVCYTLAIGTRVAKLGFLQIVSPIPVMMRIIPKQKEAFYDKWFKHLVNTYLDVFIRLAIIYFALFAVTLVPDVIDSLFAGSTGNPFIQMLSLAVVILGILMFAQQAPELLKEFFGNSGNFALKSARQQFNENKYGKAAVGYVGGAALGLASGIAQKKPLKAMDGIFRGGKNAAKNMYNADLTKKGAFTDTMKESKYLTDYQQSHTKFQAVRSAVKQAGGSGAYIDKKREDFIDFLRDKNNQSEKYAAANKLFADSAVINDLIINGIMKDESSAKDAWASNKPIALGDEYYRRDDNKGVWVDNDGNEYVKSAMKTRMDDYYKDKKASAMAEALSKNDKGQQDAFKKWSSDFNKTMLDNLPKLGDEIGKRFFNTIKTEGGIEVNSMDEMINKMDELQKKGMSGDISAFEQLGKVKVAMDKGFKDIKDGQFEDLHKKSDK